MIENWVTGVHSRRFDWKPTVRATKGSALKLNSSFKSFWLPVRSSLPSILPISFDVCKNVRSYVTLWIVYSILIPLVWVVIFKSKKGFLSRNFERSPRKFRTLIHSVQALSNHIAAKFLRKRNSLRGIPAAYLCKRIITNTVPSPGVDKTRNMEHSGTSRNIPEHEKIKVIFMKKKKKKHYFNKMIIIT